MFNGLFDKWGPRNPKQRVEMDNPMVDIASRLKVSNPHSLFHGNLTLGKSPFMWDEKLGGAATSVVVSSDVAVDMTVSQAGDYAIRQTMERFNYQAGKPQEIWMSTRMASAQGVIYRQGCFCSGYVAPYAPTDGLYFKTENGTAYCCICKGGVERAIPQSQWNMDTLDGKGPSGKILDLSKPQLMSIGFEWLGVGPVRFGFLIEGALVIVHMVHTANVSDSIYMRNCTQPLRMEIRSTGGAATCRHQCAAVLQDGGEKNFGIVGCVNTDGTAISLPVNTTRMVVAARINPATPNHQVQLLGNYLYNSVANTAYQWQLLWNPTFSGALTWNTVTDASIQVAFGTVNNVSLTGYTLAMEAGFADTRSSRVVSENLQSTLALGTHIDGTSDVIALVVKGMVGTCAIHGGLTARQLL